MQSRRDQVQAHMFVMSRITTGLLRSDPDTPESPQSRTNRGTGISAVIAVVLVAGAAVLGLISPGKNTSWRNGQSLIIDQQTGSRYLYLDGRLRPVRNYASALLIGGATLASTTVSTSSLNGTPHGAPVGITGAPDVLPRANDLDTGPWQVCSSSPGASATGSATAAVTTTLAVSPGSTAGGLTDDQAVLVTGSDSTQYLVWRGSRLRLNQQGDAAAALGYGSQVPLAVSAAFLDALPAGPDLTVPDTPDAGAAGPDLDGRSSLIGQVFQTAVLGSAPQYYELRREGLTPVTATVADLLLGDPRIRQKAYGSGTAVAASLNSDVVARHLAPQVGPPSGTTALPPSPPRLLAVARGQDTCVRIQPGRGSTGPRVTAAVVVDADLGLAAEFSPGALDACVPVDRITVRPGGGALVRALGAAGGKIGDTVYLVTDTGMKYLVSSADALKALGYAPSDAEGLPSPLLSMLPTGPDLDTAAAGVGKAVATTPTCAIPGKGATS